MIRLQETQINTNYYSNEQISFKQIEFRYAPQKLNPALVQMFEHNLIQNPQPTKSLQPFKKQPIQKGTMKTNRFATWQLFVKQKFQKMGQKISACFQNMLTSLKRSFKPSKNKIPVNRTKSQKQLSKLTLFLQIQLKPVQKVCHPEKTLPLPLKPAHVPAHVVRPLPPVPVQRLHQIQKSFILPLSSLPKALPETQPTLSIIAFQPDLNKNELEQILPQKQAEIQLESTQESILTTIPIEEYEVQLEEIPPIQEKIEISLEEQSLENLALSQEQTEGKLVETPKGEETSKTSLPVQDDDSHVEALKKALIARRQSLKEEDDDEEEFDHSISEENTCFQIQENSTHDSRPNLLDAIRQFKTSTLKKSEHKQEENEEKVPPVKSNPTSSLTADLLQHLMEQCVARIKEG